MWIVRGDDVAEGVRAVTEEVEVKVDEDNE